MQRNEIGQEELSGSFTGTLRCDNADCRAELSIAGRYGYQWDFDDEQRLPRLTHQYWVEYVNPPLRLFVPPSRTPKAVADEIRAAGQLLFINPSAAGNRLRFAVEELLTAFRVPRTELVTRTTGKKRQSVQLHRRITVFSKTHPDIAKVLLAVKWIGNAASHGQTLTVADVVLCGTVLQAALNALYDRSDADLERLVRGINGRKGLGKRKRT